MTKPAFRLGQVVYCKDDESYFQINKVLRDETTDEFFYALDEDFTVKAEGKLRPLSKQEAIGLDLLESLRGKK